MRKTDIDPNDIALISHLYWTQKTKVSKVAKDLSDEVDIKKGVRQGCVLSPSLFNLYTEYFFREIDDVPGLKKNGENINNLRYADDTVLLAESENDLQNLVTILEKSEQYGLMMNSKKTKVMVISKTESPKINIKVKGKCIEQIEQFKYLGQLITTDARSDDEIKSRTIITKSAFTKLSHIY
ncbi:endonuclease-reverse transcriptase [Elysia marginata]|uniref:Endonuclease-reverse transcriptase n=1 Tax=Elysia marginata TaxID=1093978 RepID=A0AAV4J7K2_9GAST|nr:endonuclease-reverse transcriptase [Elysia marginata]